MIPEAAVVTLSEVETLAVEHVSGAKGVPRAGEEDRWWGALRRRREDMQATLVLERIRLRSSVSAGRWPRSLQAGTYTGRGSVAGQ